MFWVVKALQLNSPIYKLKWVVSTNSVIDKLQILSAVNIFYINVLCLVFYVPPIKVFCKVHKTKLITSFL